MSTSNKTWAAGLICLAFAGAAPALAQEVTAETVVATVGGTDITLGNMIVAHGSLPPQYQQLEPGILWDGVLDQLIQQTAMAQSLGGEMSKATRLAIENQTSGLLAGEALGKALKGAVTDEAIAAAYEARFAGAEPETEFNASHILVETEDEAKAIVTELEGGADFAGLAKEKSTGPSGPDGGNLGWFGKGMMVPEFETAVMELKDGEISAPVQTQFGWHVIRLNESRIAEAPSLEEVRVEIAGELQNTAIEAELARVMEATEVEKPALDIDPSVLTDTGLIEN
ncbi:peptidylprolyl isomerase [Tropicimonas sp.]|uniref:peptidylprolyl isomerase n=1 Tax=Tropicimonas sp. TaxID=2067044 RepID=UPI003A899786